MSADASSILRLAGATTPAKQTVVWPEPNNNQQGDDMPRRPTGEHAVFEGESVESCLKLMLRSQAAYFDAQAARAQPVKANGNSQRNTLVAALLISFIPQAFNVVWWTRGTERDTVSRVESLEGTVRAMNDEVGTLRTWNEKLRINLAERGYVVDPMTAEIKPKRR